MKYLILSDLHGSLDAKNTIEELINKYEFEKIILLGDILYHGPRNDLPNLYKPKELIKFLNSLKDKIIAIKGNCDAEVDEMVLEFKLHNNLDLILNSKTCHLEHGHHLDLYKGTKDIIMYGHTHILKLEKINDIIYFNPGSITLPKENNPKSYAIMDNNKITIYDINHNIIKEIKII